MAMKKFIIEVTGTRALLMHNSRLADPLDEWTRAKKVVSAKRKKTDEDDLELSRLEWMGGLYYDETAGPYVPGDNILKSLIEAARKTKDGKRVEQGLWIDSDVNVLSYSGPRDANQMWESGLFTFRRTVKQQQSRIVRTRPIFNDWSAEVVGAFDTEVLNLEDVQNFANTAGAYIGIGDWRPRYGRFTANVIEIEE